LLAAYGALNESLVQSTCSLLTCETQWRAVITKFGAIIAPEQTAIDPSPPLPPKLTMPTANESVVSSVPPWIALAVVLSFSLLALFDELQPAAGINATAKAARHADRDTIIQVLIFISGEGTCERRIRIDHDVPKYSPPPDAR
jgi:predicted secreted protein